MEILALIIGLALGIAVGIAIGWLVRNARAGSQQNQQQTEIARLNGQLEQTANARQLLEQASQQLGEQFKATAADVLQANSRQFMELSEQNLGKTMADAKSELERRHNQFQELVKPLSENYTKLNPQIDLLLKESSRITAETNRLSTALTDNRQAGHWGEVQLRKLVELAGMTTYCDFEEQAAIDGVQPDLVVKLPERRVIVVDAKASTLAYMEAQQADDPEAADAAWQRHAQALRRQVDDLSGKDYGGRMPGSLDFVVMFVPGDQFLAAALSANPGLVEYAMGKRVVIATPASLIALLWAVANGWQQYRLTEDAARIKQVGDEMYKRLLTFINHYSRVGKGLETVLNSYNQSVGSFDRNVIPQGRRFAELVVGSETDFNPPAPIDELPRQSNYAAVEESPDQEQPLAADN